MEALKSLQQEAEDASRLAEQRRAEAAEQLNRMREMQTSLERKKADVTRASAAADAGVVDLLTRAYSKVQPPPPLAMSRWRSRS